MTDSTVRKSGRRRDSPAASGRFVLRIGADLHAELRREAAARGISLNEHCARKLAEPVGIAVEDAALQAVVVRALQLLEGSLVGVVVHGSWTGGEAKDGSDIDVLMVVDERVSVDRDLYRRWDAEGALAIDRHPADVHFARLPSGAETVSPLWAGIATDGFVVFERDRRVSRLLAQVRGRIASGRLVRRVIHGQPYWMEVA